MYSFYYENNTLLLPSGFSLLLYNLHEIYDYLYLFYLFSCTTFVNYYTNLLGYIYSVSKSIDNKNENINKTHFKNSEQFLELEEFINYLDSF